MAPQNHAVTEATTPSGAQAPEGVALSLTREITRKLLHLATALNPVGYHFGLPAQWISRALALAALVALGVEWLRWNNTTVGMRFTTWFGALLRPRERHHLTGATWLCLSCLAAVVLLPAPAAIAAMWCATIGDPAAAIVGRALARQGGHKTWAGSLACLVCSAIGVWWLTPLAPLAAVLVGTVAAVAERPQGPLDDNIRVTLATGALTLWLS